MLVRIPPGPQKMSYEEVSMPLNCLPRNLFNKCYKDVKGKKRCRFSRLLKGFFKISVLFWIRFLKSQIISVKLLNKNKKTNYNLLSSEHRLWIWLKEQRRITSAGQKPLNKFYKKRKEFLRTPVQLRGTIQQHANYKIKIKNQKCIGQNACTFEFQKHSSKIKRMLPQKSVNRE